MSRFGAVPRSWLDSRPQGIASVLGLSWGWWKKRDPRGHFGCVYVCVGGDCCTKGKYAFKWVLLLIMANVQSDTVGFAEVIPCVSPQEVLGGEGCGTTCTTGEPRKPCKRQKGGKFIFNIYA